jgi:hypothetical protein
LKILLVRAFMQLKTVKLSDMSVPTEPVTRCKVPFTEKDYRKDIAAYQKESS